MEVVAREATDEERDRLWPMVVDTYADYAVYQSRTQRKIPVLILTPDDTGFFGDDNASAEKETVCGTNPIN